MYNSTRTSEKIHFWNIAELCKSGHVPESMETAQKCGKTRGKIVSRNNKLSMGRASKLSHSRRSSGFERPPIPSGRTLPLYCANIIGYIAGYSQGRVARATYYSITWNEFDKNVHTREFISRINIFCGVFDVWIRDCIGAVEFWANFVCCVLIIHIGSNSVAKTIKYGPLSRERWCRFQGWCITRKTRIFIYI